MKINVLMRSVLNPFGLTPAELRVLAVCVMTDGCNATLIGQLTPFELSAVSRMVHKLVQQGLLVRQESPTDRRSTMLIPTEEAYETALRLCPGVEGLQNDVISALTEEQLDNMRNWIRTIEATLDEVEAHEHVAGSSPQPEADS